MLLTKICRYTMVMLFPVLFVGWKIIHRTKMNKPHEVDLIKDVEEIDEYERNFVPQESTYVSADYTLYFIILTRLY